MQAGEARRDIRAGRFGAPTAVLGRGYVQGNVAIVPAAVAADFEAFCRANDQACPLLAVGRPGDPSLPTLGGDIDIRSDLPRYRIYRDGALAGEAADIGDLWRDDFVTFVIGCSFTFESAILDAGIPLRHVTDGTNVAMFRTSIPTVPSGPFGGALVVSMRPFAPADAERAAQISARFPTMHGAPVHIGDPAAIGIADLARPDYGDPTPVHPGEVPLFWACGVTSQVALQSARLPLFIAHAPGCMLITDLPHAGASHAANG